MGGFTVRQTAAPPIVGLRDKYSEPRLMRDSAGRTVTAVAKLTIRVSAGWLVIAVEPFASHSLDALPSHSVPELFAPLVVNRGEIDRMASGAWIVDQRIMRTVVDNWEALDTKGCCSL